MRRLFSNCGLKLLSLALAILLSLYVYFELNFPVPASLVLPVQVRNLNPKLVLVSEVPRSILIRVRGPIRSLRQLQRSEPQAYLDLSPLREPGITSQPISVPDLGEVVLTFQELSTLTVEAAGKASRRLTISIERQGALDPRYEVVKEELSMRTVTVSGPEVVVSAIEQARVEPVMKALLESVQAGQLMAEANLPVRLYLAGEEAVELPLRVEPAEVEYRLRLVPAGSVRVLKVVPECTGQVAEGFVVESVTAEPQYVLVDLGLTGPEDFALRTAPLGLGGASASFDREVELRYDFATPAATLLPTHCRVFVEIVALDALPDTSLAVPVKLGGTDPQLRYLLTPGAIQLISEELPGLSAAELERIAASVSVAGLQPGQYRLAPQLSLPLALEAARIVPPSLEVTILRLGKQRGE